MLDRAANHRRNRALLCAAAHIKDVNLTALRAALSRHVQNKLNLSDGIFA